MNILKSIGYAVIGAALATVIIFGMYHNAMIKRLEINQNELIARQAQIVGAINQSRRPQAAVEQVQDEKD